MLCEFPTRDGLILRGEALGDDHAPPVLLLHGGGQTRHAWGATAATLAAAGNRAVSIDLRGHGNSDWAPDANYTLDAFAADVHDVAAALQQPPVLVGASLGGFSSLLALAEPLRTPAASLVLVDVAHRMEVAGASRVIEFMRGAPEGFADLEEAAAAVARYLPHREAPTDTAGLERNLRLRDGRWRWHWDPRLIDGSTGMTNPEMVTVLTQRVRASLSELTIPTLLVRGAVSDVISAAIADEFVALVPHARLIEVDRAAHMVAGDNNDRFSQVVVDFLAA